LVSNFPFNSNKIKAQKDGGYKMKVLISYKKYLIVKTALAYNLDIDFAENFINMIEEKHGLIGYEDNLTKCKTYKELFNFYFEKNGSIKEVIQ
jgi:hypothetical protein